MRLINADALYERACSLEAQALDYVGKLIERDGDEVSVEWKIWSAILTERTAFKHDVFDAPTIEERKKGKWTNHVHYLEQDCKIQFYVCSNCGMPRPLPAMENLYFSMFNFCPKCGSDMRETT